MEQVRKLNRRDFLRLSAVAATGTLLAACAPTPTPEVIEKVVTKEVEKEVKVEVTKVVEVEKVVEKEVEKLVTAVPAAAPSGDLIFWGHDDHPIDRAATGFVEKYPDIKFQAPHPADWGTKFQAALASGEGVPDLYWAEANEAQSWGCKELLVDLTEQLLGEKNDYHPLKWAETVLPNGKNIGWPGDISVSGWYYRADILRELGYGDIDFDKWTYDDFIQMSSELGKQGKYTFLFPAASWYNSVCIFNYRLHQVGGTLVSQDDQKIMLKDEKAVEAMRLTKQLWDSGGGLDVEWLAAPYFAAMKADELIGQFAAAWETGFWESNLTPEEGGLGNWRVTKLPGGPNIKYRTAIFGGAQLICPKAAKNRENALLFMRYALGSLEGAALCGTWGIIPSYRPYLESPLFLKDKTALFGDWPHNEFWAAQEKELSLEYFRPAGWGEVNTALDQVMPSIMKGEVSIEEGLTKAEELATPDFDRAKCGVA